MENDYLQKINLDLLQRDLGMTLEQIAELVDINPKAIYNRSIYRIGNRSIYRTISRMGGRMVYRTYISKK